jgi:hypothetical protein
VTERHLSASRDSRTGEYSAAFEPRSEPAPLRAPHGGPRGLLLRVVHLYEIVEIQPIRDRRAWDVVTTMYQYSLFDRNERELLVYHWQPGPAFAGPEHPHVHVSAALNAAVDAMATEVIDLDNRHVATGIVSLPAIVRMLIEEFDVAPRRGDWREVLERSDASSRGEASHRP